MESAALLRCFAAQIFEQWRWWGAIVDADAEKVTCHVEQGAMLALATGGHFGCEQ